MIPTSKAADGQLPPLPNAEANTPRCLVAKHLTLADLALTPAEAHARYLEGNGAVPAAADSISGGNSKKASASSGLSTLLETSHVNALNHAGDDSAKSAPAVDMEGVLAGLTPVQRSLAVARADGYDTVLVELPNERWRQRWERLCLAPQSAQSQESVASSSASKAGSGSGPARSSSRTVSYSANAETAQLAREAEQWRAAPAFNRGELSVTRLDETEGLIVAISPWLELDAVDEGVRLDSELALRQELAFAAYLGVTHVVLPAPSSDPKRRPFLADYARVVNGCLTSGTSSHTPAAGHWMSLSVRMPISSPHKHAQQSGPSSASQDDWAWDAWETVRHACAYSARLQLVLDLAVPLPQQPALARWAAEPISSVWLPSSSFLANAKGYPVLSKASQAFLRSLMPRTPTFVLLRVDTPPPQHTRGGPPAYLQYVRHLERTAPPDGPVDVFGRGYTDWLQAPLQPLMDNLEGGTYEVFERDPVKYALYEEAVYKALRDRSASASPAKIWVCGAGRGPLVSRCLAAAERAHRTVKLTALEKNPNAFVTLQEKQALEWGTNRVQLRFGDMRTYPVPPDNEKPDIVVSELLGSFGDNELSPECLDGAIRFLQADGISIPSSYTSYLTPLASAKLHHEVTRSVGGGQASEQAVQKACETPYVVLFQAALPLAGESPAGTGDDADDPERRAAVQPSWTFHHSVSQRDSLVCDSITGLPLSNSHNIRRANHSFRIPHAATCHGLAGYFEATLYGDVRLSIHPDPLRGSKDMLSWFPIFFPFRNPIYLPASSTLDVHIWRLCSDKRVWYEWAAEAYLSIPSVPSSASTLAAPSSTASTLASAQRRKAGSPAPSLLSESGQAFASAPGTPVLGPSGSASSSSAPKAMTTPVKIGMTALMNPRGRSSWIGL